MSNSRSRSPAVSDEELDHTSRNVRTRRTILPGDPYFQPIVRMEESDSEEEPFEDEEEPHSTSPSSPLLAPTPVASPSASPTFSLPDVPSPSPPAPPPPGLSLWDWMPHILDWWRRDEQVPVLPNIPGDATPDSPFTCEPALHTIPVLVARLRSHEHLLEKLEKRVKDRIDAPAQELEELHQQVIGLESELLELRDEVVTTHTRSIQTRDAVITLREEQDETRQRLTALEQEVEALRTERDQFRADAESSARFCGLMGDMARLLR